MSRLAYLTGRVVGLLVQPFIDGVLDGAFGTPDQDTRIPEPGCPFCADPLCAWAPGLSGVAHPVGGVA